LDIISASISEKTPEEKARALSFMKWARSEGAKFYWGTILKAAKVGALEVLKWMWEEGGEDREKREKEEGEEGEGKKEEGRRKGQDEGVGRKEMRKWQNHIVLRAACRGHIEVLHWAKEKGLLYPFSADFCAAKDVTIEIVRFLKKERFLFSGLKHLCTAIRGGHVDILKEISSGEIAMGPRILSHLQVRAIKSNHLHVLKWIHENFGTPYPTSCLHIAAKNNNLEMLKYLGDYGEQWRPKKTPKAIAVAGNLEILKYSREHSAPWDESTCATAAASGNLELLKWARENGCPWDERTCGLAENLEFFRWARENGCPGSERTITCLAGKGKLEIIKWARDQGFPWEGDTCAEAIRGNYPKVLFWVAENGCPCDPKIIFPLATEIGNFEILNWLKQKFPEETGDWLWNSAAVRAEHAHVFTWLQKNGVPFPHNYFLNLATLRKVIPTLWVIKEKILGPEFLGIWREIEEALDRKIISMDKRGHKVLGDPGKVGDFVEDMKEKLRSAGW
jgi:hypothetical protein